MARSAETAAKDKTSKSIADMVSNNCSVWVYFLLSAARRMDNGVSKL